ncbi:MAG TPA: S9 family peptidase [Planctomycetes bacterium]|nr:S9 family peptidase [Planctomycetota bacterium]
MKFPFTAIVWFALCAVSVSVAAQEKNPSGDLLTLMDVFEMEFASDPQISPDDRRVVYVRNSMDIMKDRKRSALWIVDAAGMDHRKLTDGTTNESSPRWSPDGSKLLYVSKEEGTTQIFLRWMDTGQTARLTQLTSSPTGLRWSPDGQSIAFSMLVRQKAPELVKLPPKPEGAEWADAPILIERLKYRSDGDGDLPQGFHHLFVLPADGGTPRQLTSGSFHHRDTPVWSPDGKALMLSGNRNPDWEHEYHNSEIYEVSVDDGTITALTFRKGPDNSPTVSPDGNTIAYLSFDDRVQTYQVTHLHLMNRDGSNRRVLTGDLDRDASSPVWAKDGSGLYFQYDDHGNTKIAFVDLDGNVRVIAGSLGGTSLGRPYGGGSFSLGKKRLAFTRTRPDHPAEVAIVETGGDAREITHLNRDFLDHRKIGRVQEIRYVSSFDKREIQGWVVTPPDFDPGMKYPLILEIHGGPIHHYGDRFTAEIQLYAAQGYVVLYANPRGSTSYGGEFGNLLHHNYPGEDYDDLISGVDALIARGFIDEKRLYVTGGSAGGIMTAWIVGKTDRFRAAVAAKPVINWYSKVLMADNYYAYHNYRYPGSPWENPEAYMKFSPISLVGNVTTPTMMLTGTDDLRTPLSESEQFYGALKMRNIDTAMVRIPGASHRMTARPSQLIAKVANVLAWFERYP